MQHGLCEMKEVKPKATQYYVSLHGILDTTWTENILGAEVQCEGT